MTITRTRRHPPDDQPACVLVDRRTGREVAEYVPGQGLSTDRELADVPWGELVKRYRVVITDPAAAMAATERALAAYDRTPRGRREARRREVAALNALVADALGRLP